MKARILPPEEWARLGRTELPPLLPYVDPDNCAVVVVEDGERIVASMAALRATHFEGLWVEPEHRGNAGVMRSLLRLSTALARMRGERFVFSGAADDRMRSFAERLGGVRMPLDFYALWVGREGCRQ